MASTTELPVLELRDEAPTRPHFTLAGVVYHFKLKSDLSLEDLALVNQVGVRMQAMTGDLTVENARTASQTIDEAARLVTHDMPSDVHATLTDGERVAIVEAFTIAVSTMRDPAARLQTSPPESAASTPASLPTASSV